MNVILDFIAYFLLGNAYYNLMGSRKDDNAWSLIYNLFKMLVGLLIICYRYKII